MSLPLDDAELRIEFARRKRNQTIILSLLFFGAAVCIVVPLVLMRAYPDLRKQHVDVLMFVGIVVGLVVGPLYTRSNWRCPACDFEFPTQKRRNSEAYYRAGACCESCGRQLAAG